MIVDDRSAVASIEAGGEPDYEGISAVVAQETDGESPAQLLERLRAAHEHVLALIAARYAGAPLDTPATLWGSDRKLGRAVAYLSSEDFYHAGQVAYIRMATDPSWDYYAEVYGAG